MRQAQTTDSDRARVRANIDSNSEFDSAYVIMNFLATVVACYGLFANSPAVVIGAMIIAMLLGPIGGVSLGLVDKNNALVRKALPTLVGGFLVVYVTAFILGMIHHDIPLTDEIYARTAPNLMDLMIALGGGAAGAYAMISPRLSVAFVGVAIATALVPPLSSSALCLARGEYALALGAFLLALTNIVGIQVAGSLVMWLGGYRGSPQTAQISALKRNLLSVAVLCGLAVFLGHELQDLVSKQIYEASVRNILTSAAKNHSGANLVEIRFQDEAKRTVVVAVYRTPSPFTPEEIGVLEPQLPLRPGTSNLELRIRSVPISVASKSGYLFSGEDLPH
jgi:uncharacterized hydrophobic protein (TIGR00271 family)